MQPPDTHADLLERPVFAHYATVRADGAPQVNPMWFLWDPAVGVIRMTHTKARHNYRNVLREPRVALSITDPDDGYRYLGIRGVVERIDDDPTGSFYEILEQRYDGTVGDVPDRANRVVLVIRPTHYRTE